MTNIKQMTAHRLDLAVIMQYSLDQGHPARFAAFEAIIEGWALYEESYESIDDYINHVAVPFWDGHSELI